MCNSVMMGARAISQDMSEWKQLAITPKKRRVGMCWDVDGQGPPLMSDRYGMSRALAVTVLGFCRTVTQRFYPIIRSAGTLKIREFESNLRKQTATQCKCILTGFGDAEPYSSSGQVEAARSGAQILLRTVLERIPSSGRRHELIARTHASCQMIFAQRVLLDVDVTRVLYIFAEELS